jgi:Mitochondrial carrier protein
VTYPLVTLSTRAQVDARTKSRGNLADLKKILDTEGLPGLFAGLKSALIGIGITNGILRKINCLLEESIISGMNGVKNFSRITPGRLQAKDVP